MCRDIQTDPNAEPVKWCVHVKEQVAYSLDAEYWHPGMRVIVPIMPDTGIWVEVHIDDEILQGGIARMEMQYQPDFGNLKKVDLGFWNPGEGLWVMRTCIVDYVKSKLDPRDEVTKVGPIKTPCPSTATHNLEAMRWTASIQNDVAAKWKCFWNIVMENACTFCVQKSTDPNHSGLDDAELNKAPWSNPGTSTVLPF